MNDILQKTKELEALHRKKLHPETQAVADKMQEVFGEVSVKPMQIKKRCPACGRTETRSSEANRRYWALLHEVSEKVRPKGEEGQKVQFSAETWHTYFKIRFLGNVETKLPNGKTIVDPQSTADLDTGQFHDYATRVEVWANEHGAFLPE